MSKTRRTDEYRNRLKPLDVIASAQTVMAQPQGRGKAKKAVQARLPTVAPLSQSHIRAKSDDSSKATKPAPRGLPVLSSTSINARLAKTLPPLAVKSSLSSSSASSTPKDLSPLPHVRRCVSSVNLASLFPEADKSPSKSIVEGFGRPSELEIDSPSGAEAPLSSVSSLSSLSSRSSTPARSDSSSPSSAALESDSLSPASSVVSSTPAVQQSPVVVEVEIETQEKDRGVVRFRSAAQRVMQNRFYSVVRQVMQNIVDEQNKPDEKYMPKESGVVKNTQHSQFDFAEIKMTTAEIIETVSAHLTAICEANGGMKKAEKIIPPEIISREELRELSPETIRSMPPHRYFYSFKVDKTPIKTLLSHLAELAECMANREDSDMFMKEAKYSNFFIEMLILIKRHCPIEHINYRNIQRQIVTSFLLLLKIKDEYERSHLGFVAECTMLSTEELNALEEEFLFKVDWATLVTPQELRREYNNLIQGNALQAKAEEVECEVADPAQDADWSSHSHRSMRVGS